MAITDKRLFKALSQGDVKAYTSIFKCYYASLLLYVRKLVGDSHAAEDIVQELFCSLWINHERLPEIAMPQHYLYRAARNRSLNWLKNNRTVPIDGLKFHAEDDILADIIEEEVVRKLYKAIHHLPGKCREIFTLKLSGMTNAEVATKLNVTRETVRSQLFRGKKLLAEHILAILALFWSS